MQVAAVATSACAPFAGARPVPAPRISTPRLPPRALVTVLPARRSPAVRTAAVSPANHPEYDSEHNVLTKTVVGEEMTGVFYLAFCFLFLMPVWFPPILVPVKHIFENWLGM